MEGNPSASRRSVLKTVGGVTAASALGGLAAGPATAAHADGKAVRVDQVGYRADGRKIAVVTSGSDLDPESVSEFEVRDAESGQTVTTGSLGSALDDSSSGHTVKHADFSDVTESGEYVIAVDGHESHPFSVGSGADVYGDMMAHIGRLYTLKRCNADIQDPITGLDIGPAHQNDESAVVAQPTGGDYLSGTGLSPGDEIDVSGGWYDAGDYGKYVTPTAVTVGQMLLSYERNPDIFTTGQFAFPDSLDDPDIGAMPDILAETKKGLEWLAKMQRLDGGLFYICSGKSWPDMTTRPSNDTQERYVFGTSSAGTAMATACFAQAARIFQEIDGQSDFADEMRQNALDGYEWLQSNPDVVWETADGQGTGSGPYGRQSTDVPDRFWAYAELLRTTGESQYDDDIQDLPDMPTPNVDGFDSLGVLEITSKEEKAATAPIDWGNPLMLGHATYFQSDGQKASTSKRILRKVTYSIESLHSGGNWSEAYGTGLFSYYWGCVKSGVSRGVVSRLGYEADQTAGDNWLSESHLADSLEPIHHVLGRSATGYSYMTGVGQKSVQNPHDRIVASTGKLPTGMVTGGPNPQATGEGDDCAFEPYSGDAPAHFSSGESPADALSYTDSQCSFATNEWAINYTAPIFMMLAELIGIDGEVPDGLGEGNQDGDDLPNVGDSENAPQDPDDDDLYEDVNGDGETNLADAGDLFQNRNSGAVQNNVDAYDFSGNDEIDLADVVDLFQENT